MSGDVIQVNTFASSAKSMKLLSAFCLLVAVSACAGDLPSQRPQAASDGFVVETLAEGLSHPWGMAFLPDGSALITERAGRLRHFSDAGLSTPIAGVPKVLAQGQGGLFDVALDNDFASNRKIYLSFAEPSADGQRLGTAVASAHLRLTPELRLEQLKVLFRMNKKTASQRHFGSRLVVAPEEKLFITLGDRGERDRAQDAFDHAGSVIRIHTDGSVPADNPFADGAHGAAEIWSLGHRNVQGAALHPQSGDLWTLEHGARGGDEINQPRAGRNYGWPIISYGTHYSGAKIGVGSQAAGLEQPVHYWDPSIAPSGLAFYQGEAFPAWQGNLLVGALRDQMLVRLTLEGGRVLDEERLIKGQYGRIRDLRVGPKGMIYLLTDADKGRLLRLSPRP